MMDRMTSVERMSKFYRGEKVDRVPFMSSATMYSGRIMELTAGEFYYDVEKSYQAQKWVLEMHGCDGNPCYDVPNGEVIDLGGKLIVDYDGPVKLPKVIHPIQSLDDAERYEVLDSSKWENLKKSVEFRKYAQFKGQMGVGISAGSPFTIVGSMVDMGLLLRWIKKEPQMVHKLVKQAEQYLLDIADIVIAEFGVENCSVSSNYPLETNDLISRKIFETFSLPYILDIHEKLREKGLKSFGIHLCGNQIQNLECYRELNLEEGSFISSDEKNSLKRVSQVLGTRNIYAGNVPTDLLVSGKPESVYYWAGELIKEMKYNEGGFILMPSCDLPINAKSVNLYAMLKACREFGAY